MVRIKTTGVALAVVFALSALTATAASAHTFEYSKTGNLLGKQTGNQVFKFPVIGAGFAVTCTKDTLKGLINTVPPLRELTMTDEYAGCTGNGEVTEAAVSSTEYDFLAEPGPTTAEVKILKGFTVKFTEGGLFECVVTIPAQGPLKTIEYVNISGQKIEIKAKVTKIKSSASGSTCFHTYTNNETGELTANNLVELVGGSLDYK
jgi:hypothetical protein